MRVGGSGFFFPSTPSSFMLEVTRGESGLAARKALQCGLGDRVPGLDGPEAGEVSDTVNENIDTSDVTDSGEKLEEVGDPNTDDDIIGERNDCL